MLLLKKTGILLLAVLLLFLQIYSTGSSISQQTTTEKSPQQGCCSFDVQKGVLYTFSDQRQIMHGCFEQIARVVMRTLHFEWLVKDTSLFFDIISSSSIYVNQSLVLCNLLEPPDIIFPFHYFW